MIPFFFGVLPFLSGFIRSRYSLGMEILALRQQLNANKNLRESDITGPMFAQRVPLDVKIPRVLRLGIRLDF